MDTTKEYILMCQTAEEIQRYMKEHMLNQSGVPTLEVNSIPDLYRRILIPRQDQLQEMIKGDVIEKIKKFNTTFYSPVHVFTNKLSEEKLREFKRQWRDMISGVHNSFIKIKSSKDDKFDFITATVKFDSFEKMWLALVMKENYNKTWNFESQQWEIIV